MNIEQILDEISRYLEWTMTVPLGESTDVHAYRDYLAVEQLKMKELERIANEEP